MPSSGIRHGSVMTAKSPAAGPLNRVTTTSSPTSYGSRDERPGMAAEPSWTTASTTLAVRQLDCQERQAGRIRAELLDDATTVRLLADDGDRVGRRQVGHEPQPRNQRDADPDGRHGGADATRQGIHRRRG